jgi:hypothetical protein
MIESLPDDPFSLACANDFRRTSNTLEGTFLPLGRTALLRLSFILSRTALIDALSPVLIAASNARNCESKAFTGFPFSSQMRSEVDGFYWTVLVPDIVNSGREEQGSVSV